MCLSILVIHSFNQVNLWVLGVPPAPLWPPLLGALVALYPPKLKSTDMGIDLELSVDWIPIVGPDLCFGNLPPSGGGGKIPPKLKSTDIGIDLFTANA